jgi:hypothetical protein
LGHLGAFGPFWAIFSHFGPFWGHLGPFGAIWGHFGPFWAIFESFGGQFKTYNLPNFFALELWKFSIQNLGA